MVDARAADRYPALTPGDITREARRWLGTPYAHQGRRRGQAVDCVGLVFGTLRAAGIGSDAFWRRQHRRWGTYREIPDGATLYQGFSLFVPEYPPAKARPGDCLLITFAGAPRHTAIYTERDTIIHAYKEVGRCVEQTWTGTWRRDTTSAFRLPEIDPQTLEDMDF